MCRIRPLQSYNVTADSNLIGRLYRSAIDHRHSTNTGQYAIGTGGQFGGAAGTAVEIGAINDLGRLVLG